MRSKIHVSQVIRHLIQTAAFIFFPGLFLSIFNALRDVVSALAAAQKTLIIIGLRILSKRKSLPNGVKNKV